jgi:hypothetical protein
VQAEATTRNPFSVNLKGEELTKDDKVQACRLLEKVFVNLKARLIKDKRS